MFLGPTSLIFSCTCLLPHSHRLHKQLSLGVISNKMYHNHSSHTVPSLNFLRCITFYHISICCFPSNWSHCFPNLLFQLIEAPCPYTIYITPPCMQLKQLKTDVYFRGPGGGTTEQPSLLTLNTRTRHEKNNHAHPEDSDPISASLFPQTETCKLHAPMNV